MNKSLSKKFGIDQKEESVNYDVSNKNGLDNSNVIIILIYLMNLIR